MSASHELRVSAKAMRAAESSLDADPVAGPIRRRWRVEAARARADREADLARRAADPVTAAAEDRCEALVMRLAADFVLLSQDPALRWTARADALLLGAADAPRIVRICRSHLTTDLVDLLGAHSRRELDLAEFGAALQHYSEWERNRVLRTPIRLDFVPTFISPWNLV